MGLRKCHKSLMVNSAVSQFAAGRVYLTHIEIYNGGFTNGQSPIAMLARTERGFTGDAKENIRRMVAREWRAVRQALVRITPLIQEGLGLEMELIRVTRHYFDFYQPNRDAILALDDEEKFDEMRKCLPDLSRRQTWGLKRPEKGCELTMLAFNHQLCWGKASIGKVDCNATGLCEHIGERRPHRYVQTTIERLLDRPNG